MGCGVRYLWLQDSRERQAFNQTRISVCSQLCLRHFGVCSSIYPAIKGYTARSMPQESGVGPPHFGWRFCSLAELAWGSSQTWKTSRSTTALSQPVLKLSPVKSTISQMPHSVHMVLLPIFATLTLTLLLHHRQVLVISLKQLTILCLELSAAVVATRFDKMVRKEFSLQVNESIFWTDSACVMGYMADENKQFHIFVAICVTAIPEVTSRLSWNMLTQSKTWQTMPHMVSAEALLKNECSLG